MAHGRAVSAMSQDTTPAPAPKKSRTLLYAGIAIVLLAGGGGTYWVLKGRAAEAAAPPPTPPAMVAFDPFVVNLADPGGSRYLRLSLALVVGSDEQAAHFMKDPVLRMRIRSHILEMLAQETAARLQTPEGKAALKAAVVAHVAEGADDLQVSDVLFSEFIVQ